MNTVQTLRERMQLNRHQTHVFLAFFKAVAAQEASECGTSQPVEEARLLTALPGQDNTHHLGWHLMHIALYEDGSFGPTPRRDLWLRYRHGTEGELPAPSLEEIETTLRTTRADFLERSRHWHDGMLDSVPDTPSEGNLTYRQLLESVVWHEAHHLNQCHGNLLRQLAS